jgi:all-trans-retinol 13,14-reductase
LATARCIRAASIRTTSRLPGFEFRILHPEAAYRVAARSFPRRDGGNNRGFTRATRRHTTLMATPTFRRGSAGQSFTTRPAGDEWSSRTLADQLADIAHPQLRAVLGARWGDYGAPPATAPFIEHAWVTGA